MKPRTAQLGARKNPDSPRVHGLRLTVNSSSTSDTQTREFQAGGSLPLISSASKKLNLPEENGANGTTARREREQSQLLTVHEVASLLNVPVSWVYGRMRKRSRERLPAYRLGKYWRFCEAEILAWLQSQDAHAGSYESAL
ncbi:MAG: helix-turn-helix domain-containing protein [Candidatus Acidiferrales bacterium]